MDNWLYKLASNVTFQTGSTDIRWEDTDTMDFTVEIFIEKGRVRVSEEKNLAKKDIVLGLVQKNVPGGWTQVSGHPNYDILKSTFRQSRPVDVKLQLDTLLTNKSFKYIKAIQLDWDRSKKGI